MSKLLNFIKTRKEQTQDTTLKYIATADTAPLRCNFFKNGISIKIIRNKSDYISNLYCGYIGTVKIITGEYVYVLLDATNNNNILKFHQDSLIHF